ncbi:unnamed protein product [Thlaspi arvense]|uniref:Bifunctional inhibitor/plant lipid transfer protein/seed storage helical domain-containing protein n=1 Tax=Thlaspi arvense TaxID=13288 RepID=A0AAU9R8N9_THLAR|nr:unnamed protein product [Thlaspi arvense]
MKKSCILWIALIFVSLCHASDDFVSPSHPPVSSPSMAPSNSDCSTVIYSMMDCLSFLTVGSTDLSPTKTCCNGVETVLEYNSSCLCIGLESSREMGFELINSRTLAMPSICNIPIDPHCDIASNPVTSTPTTSIVYPSSKQPTASPSATSSPPTIIVSSPTVAPSVPTFSHPSPANTASTPITTHSSLAITAPSPAMTALSPSPSTSSTINMLVSKQFLAGVIISSFAHILA